MHRLEEYLRRECIEIAGVPNNITNDLLKEQDTGNWGNDIGACHRSGETGRVIVKLLNGKNAHNVLEEKYKLRSINLYDDNTNTNIINQSLCPYYIGSFHVKWTKAGHDPSQILMKLFQVKGIYKVRLSWKLQHNLITRSKVMTPQSWHSKLKIDNSRGVTQLGCIFESQ